MLTSGAPVYAFGPFRLDPAERRLTLGDEPLPLAPKVLDTLVALVEADGRLVAKEALMQRLWPDTAVEEVNLARNVSLLRKALAERDNGRKYIETVPKSGYRFTGPVAKVTRRAGLDSPGVAGAHRPASAVTPSGGRRASRILAAVLVVAAGVAAIAAWQAGVGTFSSGGSVLPEPAYVRATFDGNVVESALSPDGTLVASVLRGPPMRLALRDIATGSTIEALRDEFVFHPKWSPDGSSVAALRSKIGRDGYLAIAPRLGGPPARLRGGFGAWSPDGKRVAVTYGSQRGFSVFGLDGLLLQEVRLSGFDWMIDLEWSRASDRLLLWTENAQRHTILWSVSPDGAEVRQLYAPKTRLLGAAWSPDGSAIYVLRPVAEAAELVRVPLAWRRESDEQVLIRGLTAARGFSLSADGSKLLFKRVTSVANLWRVTVGDSTHEAAVETAQLTRGASRMLSPVIAPDGQSVAFVRAEANGAVIQRSGLPIEGRVETLSAVDRQVQSFAWSPDGSQIAFVAPASRGNDLRIAGSIDATPRTLSTQHAVALYMDSVVWAPDGRLAYQTSDQRNYYLLDPESGNEQPLGSTDTGWMFYPRFSPDRSRVAVYWNRRPGGPALWTIDLRTHAETFIAGGIVPMGWSPDNRVIYGVRSPDADPEIIRVDRSTGAQTVLTRFPSGVVASCSVSRDGRQIVCSVREDTADAWIIENFDPQRTGRR